MQWTLWRGEQRLGTLLPRASAQDGITSPNLNRRMLTAFLVRAADSPPFEGVWQIFMGFPGLGVEQMPVEVDVLATREQRLERQSTHARHVVLQEMSPEEIAGVPPAQQLTMRNGTTVPILPQQIQLRAMQFSAEHHERVLRDVPAEAIDGDLVWMVTASFAPQTQMAMP